MFFTLLNTLEKSHPASLFDFFVLPSLKQAGQCNLSLELVSRRYSEKSKRTTEIEKQTEILLKIFFTFATDSGVLAQLARALDWQSKGQGFDPPILHKKDLMSNE